MAFIFRIEAAFVVECKKKKLEDQWKFFTDIF